MNGPHQAAAVVLAAGMGTRMKSDTVKVLHPVLGRSMLRRVLDALFEAGVARIVVVVGHQADLVKAQIGADVEYARQAKPLGTAHALMQAVPHLADHQGPLVVACGDTPLIQAQTFADLISAHVQAKRGATVLTAELDDPAGYGRIVRDQSGEVLAIVEHKDADPKQRAITEINTGTYCFDGPALFDALKKIRPANAQGEYYLTDALALLRRSGQSVGAQLLPDAGEALGINDRKQLAEATQVLKARSHEKYLAAGVTIVDLETAIIEPEVEIGRDTIIHPFTTLRGKCKVGEGCSIGPLVTLTAVQVGSKTSIEQTVAEHCEIGAGARIGPFVYLPPGAAVDDHERVGPGQTRSDEP
ncbi:MAG TPA: bifunctional UDP-N-acetylglucosamine diphosphorylase/glucosamine-1-phosphate N-acetyltransferase GlmU [Limnochordia bacterium]|nr:bifunctional UDP-N-acetylglucosamine diphosphorylase/glucosamine-1-phosphate N-acetyltransferase GlmU [Limnochordia bacterium]